MLSKGKVHACQSGLLDMLPSNIIDDILVLLPLRDVVRTSILSKKWRYNWCRLPQLILDETVWETAQDFLSPTIGFTSIISHLLALRTEPITNFTLSVIHFINCPKIDVLINFLSRNGIQDLTLIFPRNDVIELPSSIFACTLLRHLHLMNCSVPLPPPTFKGFNSLISLRLVDVTISCEVLGRFHSHSIQHLFLVCLWFELPCSFFTCMRMRHLSLMGCSVPLPPPTFKGFDRLVSLRLFDVTISTKWLQSLISHSPLLEHLSLRISSSDVILINAPLLRSFEFRGDIRSICFKDIPPLVKLSLTDRETDYLGVPVKCDVANSLKYFSVLEDLHLDGITIVILAARDGEVPTRHPFVLNSVKRLCLSNFCPSDLEVVLCALCLLRSLPYLQYMEIKVDGDDIPDSALKSPEVEAFADITFNHLREVKIRSIVGITEPVVVLMKLLLAKCPVLATMVVVFPRTNG